jgi:serine phosphatase RsbU (regulator of sigma subunit)/ligand-binding sensor domain-containing protein
MSNFSWVLLFLFKRIHLNFFYKILISIFCGLFFLLGEVFSQTPEGSPFIRNYKPNDYQQAANNWAIVQDHRGIMYFGNASGVLEFDGNTWTLIPVSNGSVVRSLSIDEKGIIYVGAVGDFGYLSPDSNGVMKYHSYLKLLPENEKDFAEVWKTYYTADGVYFQTFSKLFRVKDNKVKIWKPENSFHFSFFVNNIFYVNEKGIGLKKMVQNKLQLVKNGELFSALRIYSILPYSKDTLLIATREKGLFLMNYNNFNSSVIELTSPANEFLINDQVYGGIALKDKRFAYATLLNGVLIIDARGNVIQRINKNSGLQDDIVKYIALDNQNDLWLALGKGIAHAEISSPLTSLSEAQGINGTVENIIKHKRNIYIATSSGLYISEGENFVPINGIASAWSLLNYIIKSDTLLLSSTESGVYLINNKNATLIQEGLAYTLCQSKKNPERVYVGMYDGVTSIRYNEGSWITEDYLNGIENDIRKIVEDTKGNLWLATPIDGLIRVKFSNNIKDTLISAWKTKYSIQYFDTTNGLPSMDNIIPYRYKTKVLFGTTDGLFEFNEQKNSFSHSILLKSELTHSQVYRLAASGNSKIYFFTVKPNRIKETGIATIIDENKYKWYSMPFRKIKEREIYSIYPETNGITWLGGPDGLLKYNSKKNKDFSVPFNVLIRSVKIGKNILIFGGNFFSNYNGVNVPTLKQSKELIPTIEYEKNNIIFDYTATHYSDVENNKFSYLLEGHDATWSDWLTKKDKEYSDLHEGTYVFHVKAKNIYDIESAETTFKFIISPPWYRTTLAYIGYVFAVIGTIYLIIKISVRRLVKAKNQLEKVVKERTAEVVAQKHLIEEKHKEITDSINYAERIQRSFLATKNMLDENLKDYFVFFKPKDVVSGDFYWAASTPLSHPENSRKLFYVATADSTGHGVPGAIMSLLNITSLEKSVEHNIQTSDILNDTRKHIIERLKKDGSEDGGKDGMDCSLCGYDFENKKLFITAANNPVWIMRKNAENTFDAIEIKPDKMPVGKHDRQDVPFTQHEFDLLPGDVIYTLTDGFPDQFGGDKGKKFMSKNLRELLASNAHLPMKEQYNLLQTTFVNWVGSQEQIDDVTIIGVRIQ